MPYTTLFPTLPLSQVPQLTPEQMAQVDRLAMETFGIQLIQMMENAGRNLADLAQAMLEDQVEDRPLLVLAGRGNNGGGGLVAARHLANRGAQVQVVLAHDLDTFQGVPAHQLEILLAMGVSVMYAENGWELPSADLVIDALIGYGLRDAPRGPVADLIQLANSHPAPVLSLDIPSGLDGTNGQAYTPCIRAEATLTLALPKQGLFLAPHIAGHLFLADISIPPILYEALDLDLPPIFAQNPILHIPIQTS